MYSFKPLDRQGMGKTESAYRQQKRGKQRTSRKSSSSLWEKLIKNVCQIGREICPNLATLLGTGLIIRDGQLKYSLKLASKSLYYWVNCCDVLTKHPVKGLFSRSNTRSTDNLSNPIIATNGGTERPYGDSFCLYSEEFFLVHPLHTSSKGDAN